MVSPESIATGAAEARGLVRRARSASLATALHSADGWPYASLVTVACDVAGCPILLFSDLSDHTRNLKREPRAAVLVEEASGRANPQTGPRVTLLGRIGRTDDDALRRRFLRRHPGAFYAEFADFHVYRMQIERAHFVGGFGRAMWLKATDLITDAGAAEAIAACEESVLTHMNTDHSEAVQLYASRLLKRSGSGWSLVGVDPEGCDLRRGQSFARLPFRAPVAEPATLRQTLIALAEQARAGISPAG